ncbi:hypothetical protein C1X27_10855 [Pseudomonas sp. MPR-AND1B]|nr:hypothetical protein C1X26_15520 [Pseudomonas sp. MPR-R3A]PMY98840.1 hypothetical protein C1X24_07130 [Pseudomonas sp. FW305-124]PMZ68084.1 hypothetical protein C1X25_25030 [Pseudomonas sp. GW247-3R2A]PNA94149.1 hypothetical protein C1X23_09380 [Pseudomonas sp. FW300-E2]PNB03093.1 hypothetical protein C1X27_10855 [Pseudomonas sp. MPR-AND1B]
MISEQTTPLCGMCERLKPPVPPPMRRPLSASIIPTTGSMLLVLVFLAGVAVGAKMAGCW